MDILLKLTQGKNFDKIAEFYSEEFSKEPFNESWTIDKSKERLELFSKYCDVWEIWVNASLIEFMVINPSQWILGKVIFGEEMAIKSKFQRKGIGEKVFKEIFSIYKKKGFENYIGIVNKNSKSFGLHKKLGMKISQDNVIMEGELK